MPVSHNTSSFAPHPNFDSSSQFKRTAPVVVSCFSFLSYPVSVAASPFISPPEPTPIRHKSPPSMTNYRGIGHCLRIQPDLRRVNLSLVLLFENTSSNPISTAYERRPASSLSPPSFLRDDIFKLNKSRNLRLSPNT